MGAKNTPSVPPETGDLNLKKLVYLGRSKSSYLRFTGEILYRCFRGCQKYFWRPSKSACGISPVQLHVLIWPFSSLPLRDQLLQGAAGAGDPRGEFERGDQRIKT